jgi:SAM-dependent methyltransferase
MPTLTQSPDFAAVKERQRAVWAAGDYALIGATLQIVGERLCEAVDLMAGSRVIDVAAGNGNATLAAARRFARVTSTDYVAALLERGRERAAADRLTVAFQEADAEALPFADGAFDVALSTFGVMFAPNQQQAAAELVRVVRAGGKIGLASWTPGGFIGQVLKLVGGYVPPPPGLAPSTVWGERSGLERLFDGHRVEATEQMFVFRYESPQHWLQVFRDYYGPVNRAFAGLPPDKATDLERDILGLIERSNEARAGGVVIPGAYLEAVVTKRA